MYNEWPWEILKELEKIHKLCLYQGTTPGPGGSEVSLWEHRFGWKGQGACQPNCLVADHFFILSPTSVPAPLPIHSLFGPLFRIACISTFLAPFFPSAHSHMASILALPPVLQGHSWPPGSKKHKDTSQSVLIWKFIKIAQRRVTVFLAKQV